jgi:hypothetical protein
MDSRSGRFREEVLDKPDGSGVPDGETLDELCQRCARFSTKEDLEDVGLLCVWLAFEG